MMKNTILLHDATGDKWLQFAEPTEIIHANSVDDVMPGLQRIEKIVAEEGYYAAGFISYEAAPAFDHASKTNPSGPFPLLWFGIYKEPEVIKLPDVYPEPPQISEWSSSINRTTYNQKISRIKDYIREGDTYQVNFTIRQYAEYPGEGWPLFLRMSRNAPHGAFLDIDDYTICSASPELFFKLQRGRITARPMKGTVPRGRTYEEDQEYREWLSQSEKDKAENAMIVDMIRNDIGRIAKTGSVKVTNAFRLEKYPTVWQMTTTVTGNTEASVSEVFAALFPCASITGAPKVRTMEIIAELENTPRKIYTGSIGYMAPNNEAQFNVAIRTALIDKKEKCIEYGTGGGIVWDSVDSNEYEECVLKSRILSSPGIPSNFSLLETILWTPDNGYFLLDRHLNRLTNSAQYFDFRLDIQQVKDALKIIKESFENQHYKVRLFVSRDGTVKTEFESLSQDSNTLPLKVRLAKNAVDSSNPFLYHKTTHRQVYDSALREFPDYDDVILWNEKGEITESCIANVVVFIDGQFATPPISCGLLNGVYRAYLLERNEIKERKIYREEIEKVEDVYLINSVRKWQKVELAKFAKKL